ncbi:MAG: DUF1016 domain-containing protein [Tannerellaceae bacterium]|nr:DUF1016 domain-containing protein [Tannerellaceae bacterium]
MKRFYLYRSPINDTTHSDIGQMNMYMGYFDKEEKAEGDNPPIGIILSKEKDELLVEYATYGMSSQLFVSKYQLHLSTMPPQPRAYSIFIFPVFPGGKYCLMWFATFLLYSGHLYFNFLDT